MAVASQAENARALLIVDVVVVYDDTSFPLLVLLRAPRCTESQWVDLFVFHPVGSTTFYFKIISRARVHVSRCWSLEHFSFLNFVFTVVVMYLYRQHCQ